MLNSRQTAQAIVLALFLGTGFFVVWVIVAAWLTSTVHQSAWGGREIESLEICNDGTPVINSYSTDRKEIKYLTLSREPLSFSKEQSISRGVPMPFDFPHHEGQKLGWQSRMRPFSGGSSQYWFLIHDG